MSDIQLRTKLETVLKSAASGDLRANAIELLTTLGYASNKTLSWPTQPQAFAGELAKLLGGANQLNSEAACLSDWLSVSFLFQLTNDELPTLAAGQMSFFNDTGVQPYHFPGGRSQARQLVTYTLGAHHARAESTFPHARHRAVSASRP
jgi:hypothetical protein